MKRLGYKGLAVGAVVTSVLVGVAAFSATPPTSPLATLQSSAVVSGPLGATTLGNTPVAVSPSNRVNAGDTVTWTDAFQNVGTKVVAASVTQNFNPTRTMYENGSVVVPDGWEADVTTNRKGEVTSVKASAPFVPAEGRSGVARAIDAPSAASISTSIGGGGDSFELLFYKQNIYSALHHTTLKVLCFSKTDASSCGSFGPSRSLFSSDVADAWVDQSSGKAYFPAIDRAKGKNKVVISCLDFNTKSDCGITELDGDGVSQSAALVSQPWMYNGEVMFVYPRKATKELMVGCVAAATMAPCVGQPFSAGLTYPVGTNTADSRKTNVYWSADGSTPYGANGLVSYTAIAEGSNVLSLECFDSANHSACAGQTPASWDGGQDPVLGSDSNGRLSSFCARPRMTGAVTCFDLAGKPQSVPASFEAWVPKTRVSWNGVLGGYGLMSDGRSYIPLSATNPESVPCYDWKTGTSCDGFPFRSTVSRKSYSLRRDPFAPTCMWKMSDDGFLESFSTNGGPPGCTSGTLAAKPVYCADDAALHVRGWDAVRLNDLPAGAHNGFVLTLKDSTGAVVPGWAARKFGAATTVVDISSISFGGTRKALTAEIAFSGLKASVFVAGTPTMEISWKGDPLQMCTRTVVPPYCPSPYVPIDPGAIAVLTMAETGGAAPVVATRAFDYVTPATCASPVLDVKATINGVRSTDPNAPVDVRVDQPLVITYTVTNKGTTALKNPVLIDDANTAGTNDDPVIGKPTGDIGNDNIMSIGETWIYKGVPRAQPGPNALHPVLTGTPVDGNGKPAGSLPLTEDRVFYFVSNPALVLSVGIVEGHNGVGSCVKATDSLAVPPASPITYCYTLTNPPGAGSQVLSNISIGDDFGHSATWPRLGPGETHTFTFEDSNVLIVGANQTVHINANGTAPNGERIPAGGSAELGPRQLPAT